MCLNIKSHFWQYNNDEARNKVRQLGVRTTKHRLYPAHTNGTCRSSLEEGHTADNHHATPVPRVCQANCRKNRREGEKQMQLQKNGCFAVLPLMSRMQGGDD